MQFVRNGASPNLESHILQRSRLSTHPSSQPITPFLTLTPFLLSFTTTSISPSIPELLLSSQAFNHPSSLLCARASAMGKPFLLPYPPPSPRSPVPPPPSAPALQDPRSVGSLYKLSDLDPGSTGSLKKLPMQYATSIEIMHTLHACPERHLTLKNVAEQIKAFPSWASSPKQCKHGNVKNNRPGRGQPARKAGLGW